MQQKSPTERLIRALILGEAATILYLLVPFAVALHELPWLARGPGWFLPVEFALGLGVGALLLRAQATNDATSDAAILRRTLPPLIGASVLAMLLALISAWPPGAGSIGALDVDLRTALGVAEVQAPLLLVGLLVAILLAAFVWLVLDVQAPVLALIPLWLIVLLAFGAGAALGAGTGVATVPNVGLLRVAGTWWLAWMLAGTFWLIGLDWLRRQATLWRREGLSRQGPVVAPALRGILTVALLTTLVGALPVGLPHLVQLGEWWRTLPLPGAGPLTRQGAAGDPTMRFGASLEVRADSFAGETPVATYSIQHLSNSGGAFLPYIPPLLGGTLDTFDGARWASGSLVARGGLDFSQHIPAGAGELTADITLRQAFSDGQGGSPLLGFDEPVAFGAAGVPVRTRLAVESTGGSDPLAVAGWDTATPLPAGSSYTVNAIVLSPAVQAQGTLAAPLLARLTALPSGMRDPLATTAHAWFPLGTEITPLALLDALHAHVTLDPHAVPPVGTDAVRWCLHYGRGDLLLMNTTFIALGRAVGLPLRLALGYLPGGPDPTDPRREIVRERDATVWTQLAVAGEGWVDVFPGADVQHIGAIPNLSSGSDQGGGQAVTPTPTDTSGVASPTPLTGSAAGTIAPPPKSGHNHTPTAVSTVPIVFSLALLALLLASLLLLLWRRRLTTDGTVRDFFAHLAWLARRSGVRLRPSDTPRQATHKVAAALPDLGGAETTRGLLATLNTYYERLIYGPPAPRAIDRAPLARGDILLAWAHLRSALLPRLLRRVLSRRKG